MVTDTSAAVRGTSKQIRYGKLNAQNSIIYCEDAQSWKLYSENTGEQRSMKGVDAHLTPATTEVRNCVYFQCLIKKNKW